MNPGEMGTDRQFYTHPNPYSNPYPQYQSNSNYPIGHNEQRYSPNPQGGKGNNEQKQNSNQQVTIITQPQQQGNEI